MATTGEKFPANAQTISESPWLDEAWVNPTNALANDANNASVTATTYDNGDQTQVLKLYGYDFSSIPAGSTIDGVIVRVHSRGDSTLVAIDLCQLLDTARAKVGTNKASTPVAQTTSLAVYTFGSSSDLWGNSLTDTWVKDADFGVALGMLASTNNSEAYINYASIEIYYTPPPGTYGQASFRGRNDDGSESAATWKAAQNTNWTQDTDETLRVRFEIQESGGNAENEGFQLRYSRNGGAYTAVDGSSNYVRARFSSVVSDGTATTNQLTAGTGTFQAGTVDDDGVQVPLTIPANGHTEIEFVLEFRPQDLTDGDTITLRVYRDDGTALASYSQTPSITVNKPDRVTGTARISLGNPGTPGSGNRKILTRARVSLGAGVLRVQVYEGATQRSSVDHTLTGTYTNYETVVSGVTDVSNLEIRLQGIADNGYAMRPQVSWVRWSVPEPAGAPQIAIPATLTLTPVFVVKKIAPRAISATLTLTPVVQRTQFKTQPVTMTLTIVQTFFRKKFFTVPASLSFTGGIAIIFKHFETLSAGLTLTPVITKFQIRPKAVAATLTLAPVILKTGLRPQAYSLVLTPVMNRKLFKAIAAGVTLTPAITFNRLKLMTVPANLTLTVAMVLLKSRALAVTLTNTPVIVRVAKHFHTIPAGLTLTPVLSRTLFRAMAVTLNTNAAMGFAKSKFITVPATATMTVVFALRKTTLRALSADLTLVPALSRRLNRTLAPTLTANPVIVTRKTLYRTIPAGLTLTPTILFGRLSLRNISANLTAAAQIQLIRITHIQISAGLPITTVISRRLQKQLNAALTLAGDIGVQTQGGIQLSAALNLGVNIVRVKFASRALSASLTLDTALTRLKLAPRLLATVVTLQPVLTKGKTRALDANLTLTPQISFVKVKFVAIAANLVITPVITRLKKAYRTVSAGLTLTPVIIRRPNRVLAANVTLTPAFQQKKFKLLATVLNMPALIQRGGDNIALEAQMVLTPVIDRANAKKLSATLNLHPHIGFQRIIMKFRDWLFSTKMSEPVLESAELDQPELVSAITVSKD